MKCFTIPLDLSALPADSSITMSAQHALLFLLATRQDESLRQAIAERRDHLGLQDLVEMGATRGFTFTPDDLAHAFRHEWAIRSLCARRAQTVVASPHRD
jgi:hypothetical protein